MLTRHTSQLLMNPNILGNKNCCSLIDFSLFFFFSFWLSLPVPCLAFFASALGTFCLQPHCYCLLCLATFLYWFLARSGLALAPLVLPNWHRIFLKEQYEMTKVETPLLFLFVLFVLLPYGSCLLAPPDCFAGNDVVPCTTSTTTPFFCVRFYNKTRVTTISED